MKITLNKGIFELEDFSTKAIDALCERYADAPQPADDPLSFLSEPRELIVGACRNQIKIMLRTIAPEVGYSLFPISQTEMDGRFIELSGITEIG